MNRKTNAQVAAKFGISPRTVSRMRGRSRESYIEECRAIRQKAASLRSTGMTWAEIGIALGITESAARSAGRRAVGAWGPASPDAADESTGDLFGTA